MADRSHNVAVRYMTLHSTGSTAFVDVGRSLCVLGALLWLDQFSRGIFVFPDHRVMAETAAPITRRVPFPKMRQGIYPDFAE